MEKSNSFLVVASVKVGYETIPNLSSLVSYVEAADERGISYLVLATTILGILLAAYVIFRIIKYFKTYDEGAERDHFDTFVSTINNMLVFAGEPPKIDHTLEVHYCEDRYCAMMVTRYGLTRAESIYGFCDKAEVRLASPNGSYVLMDRFISEDNYTYNTFYKGFPVFDPKGKHTLQPTAIWVQRSNMINYPSQNSWFSWFVEQVDEESLVCFICDPLVFKMLCDTRFESTGDKFCAASKSRAGFRKEGTHTKEYNYLLTLELAMYYRHIVALDVEVLSPGEEIANVFTFGALAEAVLRPRPELKPDHPDPVLPTEVLPSAPTCVEVDNEKLTYTEPLEYLRPADDTSILTQSDVVITPSFDGVTSSVQEDLSYHPGDNEFDKISIQSKDSITHDKVTKRYVQKGLVFDGSVFEKSIMTNLDTLKVRIDKKVKTPTFKNSETSEELRLTKEEMMPEGVGKGRYLTKEEVIDKFEFLRTEKVKKMNAGQKARLIRVLERITKNVEFTWYGPKLQVKFFIKPDELYAKQKPRVITFVPTEAWVRTVLIIDEFLSQVKSEENPLYVLKHTIQGQRVDIYWSSGMDQEKLGKAMETAMYNLEHENILYYFVCGDDNISDLCTADFSSYDCSQGKEFFREQTKYFLNFFVPEDQERVSKLCEKMLTFHKGKRVDNYNMYDVLFHTLPSGAPWTLLFNSIGTIITVLTQVKVDVLLRGVNKKRCPQAYMRSFNIAIDSLGLDATHAINPDYEGDISPIGAEFLKGLFMRYKGKVAWIPCEGRIFKCGKVILEHMNQAMKPAALHQRICEIANGYSSMELGPILSTFVQVWSDKRFKARAVMNPYAVDDPSSLKSEKSEDWLDDKEYMLLWNRVYEDRYQISAQERKAMMAAIEANGRSFARFTNGGWRKLVQADYLGGVVE